MKYSIFAQVREATNIRGQAEYQGNQGVSYRRYNVNGTGNAARWGCGDAGDKTPLHELVHNFGNVEIGKPEYYSDSNSPGNLHHVSQDNDLMSGRPSGATFSGRNSSGATVNALRWDLDQDSYTGKQLSYEDPDPDDDYLMTWGSGRPLVTC